MAELSLLIPSRSEMFLLQTIEDVLKQSRADTEIIAVLDGEWANPAVPQHPRVNIFHTGSVVGMRAATNYAARIASGKYFMKVDAHCAFDEGFDRKMLEFHAKVGDDVTSVPIMRNLWAFDWKCLTKNTMIVTPDGLKAVSEIQEGDYIISGDGEPHKVNAVIAKPNDKNVVRIKPYLLPSIEVTEDHLVKVYGYCSKGNEQKESFLSDTAEWVEAGKLKDGKYKMIFPFSQHEDFGSLLDIENKEEIARLLGYFIAEGNFYHKNSSGESMKLTLCFNWDEDSVVDDIEKIIKNNFISNRFGKPVKVSRFKKIDPRNGNKYMRVNIYSAEATRFVRKYIIGNNSLNWQFTKEVLSWPKHIQQALLDAMIVGDGCVGYNRKSLVSSYTTSSKQLSHQVFTMMLRLGYQPRIFCKQNNGGFGKSNNPSYTISFNDPQCYQSQSCRGLIRGNEYIVHIMAIDKIEYHDSVYDLTIDGLPEILTEGGVVHNCYNCGYRQYQGPTPGECKHCGSSERWRRKIVWKGKPNPQSWAYCFDAEPHFRYHQEYKNRPSTRKMRDALGYTETMSLQGSCFMCAQDAYWRLKLSDESLGNWGNQGIEVAAKTWLSGGRVLVNHATWYAHLFRTQGGDFSFPYALSGVQSTKRNVKRLFWETGFEGQKYPLSWLIEKFWPVPGWTEEQVASLRGTT